MIRTALSLAGSSGAGARLTIFIFHRVLAEPDPMAPDEPDARRFAQELAWIADWFNVLSLEEVVNRLQSGALPPRAAAITFDDGYADNVTVALPLLQQAGLTATFFIATGYLDGGRMWNDTITESVRACGGAELDLSEVGLGCWPLATPSMRHAAARAITLAIKREAPSRRAELTARVAERSSVRLPDDLMMTSAQLRSLADAGMAIGAHTVSHPILRALDDAAALREITDSKSWLESLIGRPVALFAYPNGVPGEDYDARHVQMVRRAGFKAACATRWGAAARDSDLFQLPRFRPWDVSRTRYGARLVHNLMRRAA